MKPVCGVIQGRVDHANQVSFVRHIIPVDEWGAPLPPHTISPACPCEPRQLSDLIIHNVLEV